MPGAELRSATLRDSQQGAVRKGGQRCAPLRTPARQKPTKAHEGGRGFACVPLPEVPLRPGRVQSALRFLSADAQAAVTRGLRDVSRAGKRRDWLEWRRCRSAAACHLSRKSGGSRINAQDPSGSVSRIGERSSSAWVASRVALLAEIGLMLSAKCPWKYEDALEHFEGFFSSAPGLQFLRPGSAPNLTTLCCSSSLWPLRHHPSVARERQQAAQAMPSPRLAWCGSAATRCGCCATPRSRDPRTVIPACWNCSTPKATAFVMAAWSGSR